MAVIISDNGGSGSLVLLPSGAFIAGTPPTNVAGKSYYDGDYTVAQLAGECIFDAPFMPIDNFLYCYKAPYWQFRASFAEPAFDTPGPLGGLYAGMVKGSMKDVGGGVIEFWREYVIVPQARNEYESFNYPYCFIGNLLFDQARTQHCRVQYDYFRTTNPEAIPLPVAPHTVTFIGLSGTIVVLYDGTRLYGEGDEVLAEDATFDHWRGNIYERKQRFTTLQSFTYP